MPRTATTTRSEPDPGRHPARRAAATPLERALAGPPNGKKATPLDALAAARRMVFADGRIDMGALAKELGIGRATLYNWVGSKERLLAEVFWTVASAGIDDAVVRAKGSGAQFLGEVIERYLTGISSHRPSREFIARDPEYALRVLASRHTPFQRRLIERVAELIEDQIAGGGYEPPLDPESLAFVLVRIGESFIYADVITGSEPDIAMGVEAQRALLHAPPVTRRRSREA